MEKILGIYHLPGEGLIVEIQINSTVRLYDKQGIQHLILSGKKSGKDSSIAEKALAQLNILQDPRQLS